MAGSDDKTPLTTSLNRGLNPLNMPDYYRQYRSEDPDNDGPGEIHNPHEWSDPERSWRDRIVPDTTAKKIGVTAIGVIVLGLGIYLYPIIRPLFQSPAVIALAVLGATYLLVWLHGNQAGMERYRDLEKWVRLEGDNATVVPVERIDDDHEDGLPLFQPIKRLSYGGFDVAKLPRRDLPFETSKLKRYPDDDGTDPVTDAANHFTHETESDALGRFYVTDTGGLEWADGMDGAERYATNPNKLDEQQWHKAERLISELETELRNLRDDFKMLKEHDQRATNLRQELQVPEIQTVMTLIDEFNDAMDPRHRTSRRDGHEEKQTPIAAPVTPRALEDSDGTEGNE